MNAEGKKICADCGAEMVWQSDYMLSDLYEDCEVDGVVAVWECPVCEKQAEEIEYL